MSPMPSWGLAYLWSAALLVEGFTENAGAFATFLILFGLVAAVIQFGRLEA